MSGDGIWRLTFAAVAHPIPVTIKVRAAGDGRTIPEVFHDRAGITFRWKDGHSKTYFAANLLCAEFIPEEAS